MSLVIYSENGQVGGSPSSVTVITPSASSNRTDICGHCFGQAPSSIFSNSFCGCICTCRLFAACATPSTACGGYAYATGGQFGCLGQPWCGCSIYCANYACCGCNGVTRNRTMCNGKHACFINGILVSYA